MYPVKIRALAFLSWLLVIDVNLIGSTEIQTADDDDNSHRSVNRDFTANVDEGSCICGLNKEILAKIEAIVIQASKQEQTCSIGNGQHGGSQEVSGPTLTHIQVNEVPVNDGVQHPSISTNNAITSQQGAESAINSGSTSHQDSTSESLISKLTHEIQTLQAQLVTNSQPQSDVKPQQNSGSSVDGNEHERPQYMRPDQAAGGSSLESSSANSFLQGLSSNSISTSLNQQNAGGVSQPDQAGQTNIQNVQNALELTVPSVVSNIFSNIQDLAIQTEHNPNATSSSGSSQSSNFLTSIDGSSVHLDANETADEITAQGEQLFLQWIDHQIQAFHMTASMASYIRKSGLNLFRRIVKQYVQRIGRLGGRVEDNVRKATQVALNNTQNLIAFLLRNYLNVAGGIMQIIGEQVSRVGKQLDSTGDTIAHINLNPFDIVSNVIGSLPNPSHYSEYFRAFGKYLMGETQQETGSNQQVQDQDEQQGERMKGLLSKTMGAFGKTLGSWLGR